MWHDVKRSYLSWFEGTPYEERFYEAAPRYRTDEHADLTAWREHTSKVDCPRDFEWYMQNVRRIPPGDEKSKMDCKELIPGTRKEPMPDGWTVISMETACETNPDGVERYHYNQSMPRTVEGAKECMKQCDRSEGCTAVDFYSTGWCNFYKEPCKTPQRKGNQCAASYRKLPKSIDGNVDEDTRV